MLYLVRPQADLGLKLRRLYGDSNAWVVVTGCTEGIGKAFVRSLAGFGFNIVLVGRGKEKVQSVAQEVRAKFGVQVKEVLVDFRDITEHQGYAKLSQEILTVDVAILINNVGVDLIERFDQQDPRVMKDMILTNMWPDTFVTRYLLPAMARRKRSAVVTVSSLAGKTPMNNFSTYAATKSFVSMLSNCLVREYNNVDFLDFTPSKVSTAMNKYMPTNKFTVTAE